MPESRLVYSLLNGSFDLSQFAGVMFKMPERDHWAYFAVFWFVAYLLHVFLPGKVCTRA
jgi:hypothetical protein